MFDFYNIIDFRSRFASCISRNGFDFYIKTSFYDPSTDSYFYVLKVDSDLNFYNDSLIDTHILNNGFYVPVHDPMANIISASRSKLALDCLHALFISSFTQEEFLSLPCSSFYRYSDFL